jgi:hypothetical protein
MGSALEQVAKTAEDAADVERDVAKRARSLQKQRERGLSWHTVLQRDDEPAIFDLLRRGARLGVDALSAFSSLVAEELSEEGASRRQIARVIGVTHQRVSAILGRGRRGGADADDAAGA